MATTVITDQSEADKMFGYAFGVDGLMKRSSVERLLDCSHDTIDRMVDRNEIRSVKLPTGHTRICKRSVMNYIASLKEQ
jgi:excisionase family DNA binding protein